jgi:hypothetical protein
MARLTPTVSPWTCSRWDNSASRRAMSPVVQVFGRRHEEAIHALRRPASEKRQCTKSRECGTLQCSECYGDRMLVAISMVDAARAECFHNFRVLA